jgi:glycosyltransferase involved in cell wall biosynthesis
VTRSRTVLHVLAPAREGGLERVVAMLTPGQKPSGVHVAAVLTPTDAANHPFVERMKALGVPITTVIAGSKSYIHEYRAIASLASRLDAGIVHTHGYRADVIGTLAARSRGIRAVSTAHGFTGGGFSNRIKERIQCFALRHSDAVIAVSAPLVGLLASAGVPPEIIRCIPNGFVPATNYYDRPQARARLEIPVESRVVGWVGRLSREKGLDVALDALAQAEPDWRLSVLGDGPESANLRRRADDLGITARVTWHGAVQNAGSLLRAFDAFVLSSRTEGTPIALFEAIDARVPIVATAVGGVPDVVTDAHAILVPSEQPRAIAAALAELRRDPTAAVQRTVLARERLVDVFGEARWVDAIESVYEQVLARR